MEEKTRPHARRNKKGIKPDLRGEGGGGGDVWANAQKADRHGVQIAGWGFNTHPTHQLSWKCAPARRRDAVPTVATKNRSRPDETSTKSGETGQSTGGNGRTLENVRRWRPRWGGEKVPSVTTSKEIMQMCVTCVSENDSAFPESVESAFHGVGIRRRLYLLFITSRDCTLPLHWDDLIRCVRRKFAVRPFCLRRGLRRAAPPQC